MSSIREINFFKNSSPQSFITDCESLVAEIEAKAKVQTDFYEQTFTKLKADLDSKAIEKFAAKEIIDLALKDFSILWDKEKEKDIIQKLEHHLKSIYKNNLSEDPFAFINCANDHLKMIIEPLIFPLIKNLYTASESPLDPESELYASLQFRFVEFNNYLFIMSKTKRILAQLKTNRNDVALTDQLKNLIFVLLTDSYCYTLEKSKVNSERIKLLKKCIELFKYDIDFTFIHPTNAHRGANTLLHEVATGFHTLIPLVLDKGANPNRCEPLFGNTPLLWSVANGANTFAKEFILECQRINRPFKLNLNCSSEKYLGNTPLLLSVAKGHEANASRISNFELTKFLIEQGADVNQTDKKGNSPLHIACLRRDIRTVELLLQHGAKTDIQNHAKQSPTDLLTMTYSQVKEFIDIQTGKDARQETFTLPDENSFNAIDIETIKNIFAHVNQPRNRPKG